MAMDHHDQPLLFEPNSAVPMSAERLYEYVEAGHYDEALLRLRDAFDRRIEQQFHAEVTAHARVGLRVRTYGGHMPDHLGTIEYITDIPTRGFLVCFDQCRCPRGRHSRRAHVFARLRVAYERIFLYRNEFVSGETPEDVVDRLLLTRGLDENDLDALARSIYLHTGVEVDPIGPVRLLASLREAGELHEITDAETQCLLDPSDWRWKPLDGSSG